MTFLDVAPRQTEKQWMAQVIALAELFGWKHYHTHRSEKSTPGFPDLVLVRRPRILFCELKAERNTLTAEQTAWLLALRECGQEVYVWRPSDVDKVTRCLRRGSPNDRA